MPPNFKYFYALCLLTCLGICQLYSQENQDTDPNKLPPLPLPREKDAVCRCVTTFPLEKNKFFYIKIGESFHIAPLRDEGISIDIPIIGPRKLTLYQLEVSEEGNETYIPAVEVPLEGVGKRFLIVLNKQKDKSISGLAYNLNTNNFPSSNIYVFNQTPTLLGLQINEAMSVVRPYKDFTYKFPNSNRNSYTSARIIMKYNGENKVMASKRLRLVPGRRIILVCFPSRERVSLGATPLRMITYQDKP